MNIPYLKKKELYSKVKRSELYDSTLKMYKVNASIQEESMEIGRARACTPGWLENESIWLHMEYKYLLELLKSELYEEFIEDFKNAVIPFLEEDVYGRSLLENSSFIASSANPNHEIHGKGFVARLSGSTVEFLDMWQIMMFGKTPFELYDGEILLNLTPTIPDYQIGNNKEIQATFLGDIKVIYILPDRKTILPTNTNIEKYEISYIDNDKEIIIERISTKLCNEFREKKVSTIKVTLKRLEL